MGMMGGQGVATGRVWMELEGGVGMVPGGARKNQEEEGKGSRWVRGLGLCPSSPQADMVWNSENSKFASGFLRQEYKTFCLPVHSIGS